MSGGGVAPLWAALSRYRGLEVVHFQHESGAAFAATEAYFAARTPVALFTTTGPGLTNALTGILAARTEGAVGSILRRQGQDLLHLPGRKRRPYP